MTKLGLAALPLIAIGCSKAPTMPSSPPIAPKGPSDEKVVSISFDPVVIRTENRSGESSMWVPSYYENGGEEKLKFEKLKTTPTSEQPQKTTGPQIRIGGDRQQADLFEGMVKTFVTSANRKQFPIVDYGFAPFGLTSDLYFGHTFWDLDVWMVPAFIFLAPDAAKSAAQYRIKRSKQASLNYIDWMRSQGPKGEIGGLKYPWESSVSGKEVCLQETKNQQHLSGDVIWGLTQSEAMGLTDSAVVKKIANGVKTFYNARSKQTTKGREILDVVSPNEKFIGNNDLYTNLLAEWVTADRDWKREPTYYLPRDQESLLNYDGDPLHDYQQAAGLLAIFPLQAPVAEREAKKMLERFGDKISSSGPAMGHAVVATAWARQGEPEKAYKAWQDCWRPFLTGPNQFFSERRNAVRPYFYTGAAGAINTVIYGFAGLRIDRIPLPGAKWTKRLKSGWWLSAKPCVPKEIESIEMAQITIDGEVFNFSATSDGNFSAILLRRAVP